MTETPIDPLGGKSDQDTPPFTHAVEIREIRVSAAGTILPDDAPVPTVEKLVYSLNDRPRMFWDLTENGLAAAQAMLNRRIEDAVGNHITASVSIPAQTNIQAAAIELLTLSSENPDAETAPEVKAARDAMFAVRAWIKNARDTGRLVRESINAAETPQDLDGIKLVLPDPPLGDIAIAKAAA